MMNTKTVRKWEVTIANDQRKVEAVFQNIFAEDAEAAGRAVDELVTKGWRLVKVAEVIAL